MTFQALAPLALAAAMVFMPACAGAVSAPTASKPAAAAPSAQTVHRIALKTGLVDGKMVYLDARGNANPQLRAKVGDIIEFQLSSGEGAEHDLVIPQLKAASRKFDGKSGGVSLRVQLTQAGTFSYYCSIAGHRQVGMEGVLVVDGPTGGAAAAAPSSLDPVARQAGAIAAAAKNAVSVVQNPASVPPALGARAPQLVRYDIETVELDGRLDDGTTFTYWTFGRKVPGPMLRVKQGDTVELRLSNAASSKAVHSIDLHAVTGGAGGGADTQVAPGQSKTIRFKALNSGLYVYHCATPSVPHHISAGMYGLILVEPPEGLPKVDREFYVMQGDLYTAHPTGTKGHHVYSPQRADDELPTYYTFNGAVGALTKENALKAKVGETVRIYFGVGGPNKVSSFHVIGEIFDKVYSEASLKTVKTDVQTTLVPAGGATIVEFKVDHPGKYTLVDHALSRAGKGLAGTLEVTGPGDASIYQPLNAGAAPAEH